MSVLDPVATATTFALILPAELPDKTMIATLVLATRYRPLPVWLGVSAAFVVQCVVAVVAGGLLGRLPHRPVLAISATLFAVGAVLIGRDARRPADEEIAREQQELSSRMAARPSAQRMAATSFGVLFAAEWGDLSQLLTAALAARYRDPVGVFIGSWTALVVVAGLAVVAGRTLVRVVPLPFVRRVAAALFGVLAIVTALEAAGVFG